MSQEEIRSIGRRVQEQAYDHGEVLGAVRGAAGKSRFVRRDNLLPNVGELDRIKQSLAGAGLDFRLAARNAKNGQTQAERTAEAAQDLAPEIEQQVSSVVGTDTLVQDAANYAESCTTVVGFIATGNGEKSFPDLCGSYEARVRAIAEQVGSLITAINSLADDIQQDTAPLYGQVNPIDTAQDQAAALANGLINFQVTTT